MLSTNSDKAKSLELFNLPRAPVETSIKTIELMADLVVLSAQVLLHSRRPQKHPYLPSDSPGLVLWRVALKEIGTGVHETENGGLLLRLCGRDRDRSSDELFILQLL